MKLAFVGTCQTTGLAAAAARMLPDAIVTGHSPLNHQEFLTVAEQVRGYDFVVTQFGDRDTGSPLAPDALTAAGSTALFMPPAVFPGFHPDMLYLLVDGKPIDSGMGPYHSQIAVAGYILGLDLSRVRQLYNAHVFAQLGHFDAFDQAVETMVRTFRRAGFRLRSVIRRLIARRCIFMHTINHPTIDLLERLAVLALERLELIGAPPHRVRGIDDALADGIVSPVFAPIARRIGVDPMEHHLRPVGWTPPGEARQMSIDTYLEKSFLHYAHYDRSALTTPVIAPVVERLGALLA